MARPLGSGPIYIFLGFGPPITSFPDVNAPPMVGVANAVYYGTTREGPEINERLDFYSLMNDITGPKQSMDEGFAGREDDIGLTMTNIDQTVESRLEAFLAVGTLPQTRGILPLSALGTLILSEGQTIGIWLLKGAAGKAINRASGMPLGRYYPTCIPVGPVQQVEGNKENRWIRKFTAKKDINALNLGILPLFYEDDASFAGLASKIDFG